MPMSLVTSLWLCCAVQCTASRARRQRLHCTGTSDAISLLLNALSAALCRVLSFANALIGTLPAPSTGSGCSAVLSCGLLLPVLCELGSTASNLTPTLKLPVCSRGLHTARKICLSHQREQQQQRGSLIPCLSCYQERCHTSSWIMATHDVEHA